MSRSNKSVRCYQSGGKVDDSKKLAPTKEKSKSTADLKKDIKQLEKNNDALMRGVRRAQSFGKGDLPWKNLHRDGGR